MEACHLQCEKEEKQQEESIKHRQIHQKQQPIMSKIV